jgi:hypothetical protein
MVAGRYGLLETLGEYAFEKLHGRGSELTATPRRHATYYSALVQQLDPASPTPLLLFFGEALTTPMLETLDDVHDNVRVALRYWLTARPGSPSMASQAATHPTSGRNRLRRLGKRPQKGLTLTVKAVSCPRLWPGAGERGAQGPIHSTKGEGRWGYYALPSWGELSE